MFICYWYKKEQKSTMFLLKILRCHINECFKINDKQKIKMSKRWTCCTEKSLKENKVTIFDLCMFWKHFSSKKKLGEKCKWVLYKQISKHVAYSYCSKLISIDDKFSKPKSYLGEDAVCNFINNTVQESQYCSEVMQRQFNKDFAITKTDDEDF